MSAPTGTVTLSGLSTYATTTNVTLNLTCSDTNNCSQMRFSNNGTTWSSPVSYPGTPSWNLNDPAYGGNSNDGSKTVYAQFKDTAGNWSTTVINKSIILDTTAPTGSITINNLATYATTTSVELTLTCNDTTSGCATMEFKNDADVNWSTPEAFNAAKTWTLSTTNGTRTVNVRFTDAAGKTSAYSDTIILDNHAPVTTATPGGGAKTGAVGVTLSCADGSGIACGPTYYTTNGSPPDTTSTLYTGATITISGAQSPVYLKYFSVDALGNPETPKTDTYTFVSGYTTLTLDLASPTLLQNGLLNASGKLTRYPDSEAIPNNGMDLSGLTIELTITGPAGSTCAAGCQRTTTTYSDLGHYQFEGLDDFSYKGAYSIKATFAETGLHQASDSTLEPLLVGSSAGYAVIVEGKVSNNEGLLSHNKTANRVYDTLKDRGFEDDNIYYLNYNDGVSGVDAPTTKTGVEYAVTTWAEGRMNGAPAPLYVIFVDHGNQDTFYIHPDTITPTELDQWLSTLESSLNEQALLEKRIVVLGACYSGSFIGALSSGPTTTNGGRIVISSAAADEQSYKGPNEPDGIRSGEFFLEEFFKQLKKGASLRAAFVDATALTEAFTSQGSGSANAVNVHGDSSVQHPLLDDDGDSIGGNALSDGSGDGVAAAGLWLGIGVTNASLSPADLKSVTGTLSLGTNTDQAQLLAEAYSDNAVSSAWFEVKSPNTTLSTSPTGTATGQLDLNIPRWPMTLNGTTHKWESTYGSDPLKPLESFVDPGKYEVYYFTKSTNAQISEMKRSVVYKDTVGNTAPAAFNLLAPADATQTKTALLLQWEASADLDGLTYTVQVATDSGFTNIKYQAEELTDTWLFLGDAAGLSDQTTYYWRVIAVDSFGKLQASLETNWSFHTDNTNFDLPAVVSGVVTDKTTGTAVAGATVSFSNGVNKTTDAAGKYVLVLTSGADLTATATQTGYLDSAPVSVTAVAGAERVANISLVPENPVQYALTVNKTGSGTITSTGISCGTDCTETYTANQSVTLTAAANAGSSFTGWSGACSGTGICIVSMASDKTVTAAFSVNAPTSFTVSPSAGTGGSISPNIAQTVNTNNTTSFTITPTTGYQIGSVTGCGGNLSNNTYTTGAITTACTVTASFTIKTYTIGTAATNGTITCTPSTVNHGTNSVCGITPNTGYTISEVFVDGSSIGAATNYTFSSVTANHTISASFTPNTYTVTATGGTGGTVTPATQMVNHGNTATIAVTPNTGYHISSVTGCGGTLNGNAYTTSAIITNCSVTASFAADAPNTYAVTPSAGTGGSISPNTAQTVSSGATTSFTIATTTGYQISSVAGCGGTLTGNTYTTGAVNANCTVSATFVLKTYTVSAAAGSGGSMTPSAQTISHGGSAILAVTPNTGYHISSVTGCGGTLNGNAYTTGAVTSACTVTASFAVNAPNTYTVTPSAGTGGSISPAIAQTVSSGATTSFTIATTTGYQISSVTGCGGTLTGNTYTTAAVNANCTVSATFVLKTYTVSSASGSDGSMTPSAQIVNHGNIATIAVTPDAGYHINAQSRAAAER